MRAQPLPIAQRWGRAAFAVVLAAIALAVLVPSVSAHVNRTVGRYQILVVLVEEPTFQDNHAGFQFWVKDGDALVAGLESTVRAQALRTSTAPAIDLAVPPMAASGFYVLDRSPDGLPFDPGAGGAWTLRLRGTIESTALDESIPVNFPSYPRVAVSGGGSGPAAVGASASGDPPLIAVIAGSAAAIALATGLVVAALRGRRRSRSEG